MGADTNHLCPVTRYSREFPILSARVVLARTSEPALLLRHPHAQQNARFFLRRREPRIISGRKYARLPFAGQLRFRAQRRHGRERHGNGTRMPGFILGGQHHERRSRHVRAFSCARAFFSQGRLCSRFATEVRIRLCHAG